MILGDLLVFLIQSPADFYDTWRTDWRRQENESITFWERSGRSPDPDQSGNLYSNPRSLLVELDALAEVCALLTQSTISRGPLHDQLRPQQCYCSRWITLQQNVCSHITSDDAH